MKRKGRGVAVKKEVDVIESEHISKEMMKKMT